MIYKSIRIKCRVYCDTHLYAFPDMISLSAADLAPLGLPIES